MAWRDSRASRRRLLLFSTSIAFGVAALVGIGSFRKSLSRAIDEQARSLIGADLIIESTRAFTPDEENFISTIGESRAREVRFSTMAAFPRGEGARLVQLRAIEGEFPFYGAIETQPAEAWRQFRNGKMAIVDGSVLLQFRTAAGDPVRIGDVEFQVAGSLSKIPGEATASATLAPRVYIPLAALAETQLVRPGSVARHRVYVKFSANADVARTIDSIQGRLREFGLSSDTVAQRKKDLGRALENLYRFLNLIGFVSLLLGAIGVASAIHAHLQQKQQTAAILRCLGASARTTLAIYFVQALAMGVVGALTGALLGVAIQGIFPRVLQAFVPLPIPTEIPLAPIFYGIAIGIGVCVLFALPPLLRFRNVAPLSVLRGNIDNLQGRRGLAGFVIDAIIAGAIVGFAILQAENWQQGLIFSAAFGVAAAALFLIAKLSMLLLRKLSASRWSFVLRQGIANLYRPNNRTLLLTMALGLSTFLLLTLYLSREVLLTQFRGIGGNSQANIFLFDIQADQRAEVISLVQSLGLPVIQEAPIVSMRLVEIKGRKVSDILADPKRTIPEWQLEREYRSTYRAEPTETEAITAGQWVKTVDGTGAGAAPISLEQDIARDFGATIGDELVFDVAGLPIKTKIASLRRVDWKRFQTNFFVVFPTGVLENAPGFYVLVSRVASPAESARLQNAVVSKFSNVSAIDLTAVIEAVDSILSKVALAIRIMSMFTVGAGLLVLASTIWSGRYQRLRETVLLRTLGASRKQIWQILGTEYLCLALLASITGIALALFGSWALAVFVFKLAFAPPLWPLAAAAGLVSATTLAIGLLTSWGVAAAPPLEVLRSQQE